MPFCLASLFSPLTVLLGPILSKFSKSSINCSMCEIPSPIMAKLISSLKCLASFCIMLSDDNVGRNSFASTYTVRILLSSPLSLVGDSQIAVFSSARVELAHSNICERTYLETFGSCSRRLWWSATNLPVVQLAIFRWGNVYSSPLVPQLPNIVLIGWSTSLGLCLSRTMEVHILCWRLDLLPGSPLSLSLLFLVFPLSLFAELLVCWIVFPFWCSFPTVSVEFQW